MTAAKAKRTVKSTSGGRPGQPPRSASPHTKSKSPQRAGGSRKVEPAEQGRDWRQETLARMRAMILQAEPALIEERKWKKPSNAMAGVPVWSHPRGGIVCTGEIYTNVVKLTFARGASLPDPSRLFNS